MILTNEINFRCSLKLKVQQIILSKAKIHAEREVAMKITNDTTAEFAYPLPYSRRHLPVRRIRRKDMLQWARRQRSPVPRNRIEAVLELLVQVVPIHLEAWVAQPPPPLHFEVRPHLLDRVQLRRRRRENISLMPYCWVRFFAI